MIDTSDDLLHPQQLFLQRLGSTKKKILEEEGITNVKDIEYKLPENTMSAIFFKRIEDRVPYLTIETVPHIPNLILTNTINKAGKL